MHHVLVLTALAFLAVVGAALAGPAEERASGRLARMDRASRTVVVRQGAHELTFVLAATTRVVQDGRTLSPDELASEVGHTVKVRYSTDTGASVARQIDVEPTPTSTPATAPPAA